MGQQVALPVDPAALLRGVEDAGGGGAQALVVVGPPPALRAGLRR